MAISTTTVAQGAVGNLRYVLHKHTTPGTGANDVDTGASYVIAAFAQETGTANKAAVVTPNTSDHSTASNGHYTLEAEADDTVYVLAFVQD